MQITGTPDEIAEFMNLLKSDYRGDCTIEKDVNRNKVGRCTYGHSSDCLLYTSDAADEL